MPKLRSLDPNLADAALDLGATPWQALTKVIVPQIMPGIVSGALIAFNMSFDDFIISYFVTGNGVNNISILVYTMSKRVNPSINALSTLIILMITAVLIIINVVPIIKEHSEKKKKKQRSYKAIQVNKKVQAAANLRQLFCCNAVSVVSAVYVAFFILCFSFFIFYKISFVQKKYSIYGTTLLVKQKIQHKYSTKSNTNITQLQQLQRWAMDTDGKTGYGITQNTELQF